MQADAIVEREERLVHAASGAAEVAHHALREDFALARVVRVEPLRHVRLPDGLAVIVVLGRACSQRDACSRTNTKGGGGQGDVLDGAQRDRRRDVEHHVRARLEGHARSANIVNSIQKRRSTTM